MKRQKRGMVIILGKSYTKLDINNFFLRSNTL